VNAAPARHVASLEGVRGIAIAVFLLHNLSLSEERRTLAEKLWTLLVEFGWAGIALGFVLSGFLVTGILLDDRDVPRAGSLRSFWVRRALRVVPLYYGLLLAYVLVAPQFEPALRMPWTESIWYWAFTCNWSILALGERPGLGPTWAVAAVVQFYLFSSLVVGRVRASTLAVVCVVVIVVALLTRVGLYLLGFDNVWSYVATVARADCFALGALVALGMRSEAWRPRLARAIVPTLVGSAGVIGLILALAHGLSRASPLAYTVGYSAFAFGSAGLVAIAARPDGGPRWLAHPVLVFLGRHAYGLYLMHSPLKHAVMWWLGTRLTDAMAARPVAIDAALVVCLGLASVAFALVSSAVLERPLLRPKELWAPRQDGGGAPR
jgi:peptidoglycan/LPS O-acetylase OafA/YrhL